MADEIKNSEHKAPEGHEPREQKEQKLTGFAQFIFFKLDMGWHRLDDGAREEGIRQFVSAVEGAGEGMNTKMYSTVGFRPDVDFFMWNRSEKLIDLHEFAAKLGHTGLGKHLHTPFLYISLYRESPYPTPKDHEAPKLVNPRYLFVYPFIKTRAWYKFPMETRMRAMREHIAVGHKFDRVKVNTSYSFGLGDQEFVIAFDTDYPEDFEALVRRLRDTEASQHTLQDTPIFMGYTGTASEVIRTFA